MVFWVRLSQKSQPKVLPHFFRNKVDAVCLATSTTPPYDVPYKSTPTINEWTAVTADEIEKLIGLHCPIRVS